MDIFRVFRKIDFRKMNLFYQVHNRLKNYKELEVSMKKQQNEVGKNLFYSLRKTLHKEIVRFYQQYNTSFKRHYKSFDDAQIQYFVESVSDVMVLDLVHRLKEEGEEIEWLEEIESIYHVPSSEESENKTRFENFQDLMEDEENGVSLYTYWYKEVYLVDVMKETKRLSKSFIKQEEMVFCAWLKTTSEEFYRVFMISGFEEQK